MSVLKKIHDFLMAVGLVVAKVLTWIIMPVIYWVPFGLTAVLMKLFAKPLLPQYGGNRDELKTYWLDPPELGRDMEKMKRQF